MRSLRVAFGIVVSLFTMAGAVFQPLATAGEGSDFPAFLRELEKGTTGFVNGDPTLWKTHVSRGDDVTLMGGWGTTERGWTDVVARYDWAAARFAPSGATVNVEYVSSAVSGDLAYTVAIERSRARVVDRPASAEMSLRVTHVFRREAGTWKLVHRHADPLMETTTAGSVLKK